MKCWDTVAIVGVGLIGGSIGLKLLEAGLARSVVGVGRRVASLRAARRRGAISSSTTKLARGVNGAELIVVCTPVELVVEHVVEAAANAPRGALITDAGSTKRRIVTSLEKALPKGHRFVGSHPLAGSEKTGPLFARADLFDNRTVVVTPTRRSDPEAVQLIERFWSLLGSHVQQMSPQAHDQTMAAISHLPHLLASALAASTSARDRPLASTGWLDTTRIAAGDVELWRQIFTDNRDPVLDSLRQFEQWLARFRQALERDDQAQLEKLLEAGKQSRDAVGS